MRCSAVAILIATLAVVVQTANAETITCDFANVAGSSVTFTGTGDTITFPNTGTYDFLVTGGSPLALVGLNGNIGGTFTVGAITSPFTGLEQANVTTSDGAFSLYDGVSATLTANLDLKDIVVYNSLFGVMNASGVANLSGISYTGSNSDLLAIENGQQPSVVMTFQFSPLTQKSLTQLMTDGQVNSTSYSGSLSVVPEPSFCAMLGGAAVGLLLVFRRRRKTA